MQTRDYDDYIYVSSTLGYRKVDDSGAEIDVKIDTDGYCNMYADNISVSYLHSMNEYQINAIHYFEDNHEIIFQVLEKHLLKKYKNLKNELGFSDVNILDKHNNKMCFIECTFIDVKGDKIKIEMVKDKIQKT